MGTARWTLALAGGSIPPFLLAPPSSDSQVSRASPRAATLPPLPSRRPHFAGSSCSETRTFSVGSRRPAACAWLHARHQCRPNGKGDRVTTDGWGDGGACVDVDRGGQGAADRKTRELSPDIIPNSPENRTTAPSLTSHLESKESE